ncbi:MAG: nitrilase-related carbon-nitrogen hydrolase [Candidatus Neomarinimicrobiota bacterium]
MKIGIYQFTPVKGRIETNLKKISRVLARSQSDLWILPELCTTGYVFSGLDEVRALAEDARNGATAEVLCALTRQHQTALILGMAEKSGGQVFNSAVVFDRGEWRGVYRKVHLFYEEKKWFSPGMDAPPVIEIQGVKVGVMICFDWLFPEMARSLALRGAQIIAHPANLVLPYCQDAMLTRSLENRVFTATANRIGHESLNAEMSLTFTGQSQITNPKGKRLGRLPANRAGILVRDIDPAQALDKKFSPLNDIFQDRRPEIYRTADSRE